MIERYTRSAMGHLWSEEAKYGAWLRVEIAVCEAYARQGRIPAPVMDRIRATRVDVPRILAIQQKVKHEMIALLTSLEEQLGDDSRFVHIGLTTNDVWDTATALQLRDAVDLLITGQERLRRALGALARRHRDTLIVGRTHGVHAEPTTFGMKVAVWYVEAGRNLDRLRRARDVIAVGKLSGAVGQFAHSEPAFEEDVCRTLGLGVEPVSTQVVQRDRHAELLTTLAIVGASLEKIALEVRGLQRTEVLEAQEPFAEGQKGSSAMPHKRNPELAERICGLARLLRGNAAAGLENVALWHERDISHSSVERVVLPDSTIALDYILDLTAFIVEGLEVDPARMAENLESSYGLIYSQRVLLKLTEAGLARQKAYEIVQRASMRAWKERRAFAELLNEEPAVTERLAPAELKACFDPSWYVRNVNAVFRRAGLEGPQEERQ
ncbi:MAG TPA: adenylosuccinate lyase [Methylomirabilota bacterium]|nr:adenylosuccinate lyase [Methylomirabilota bacterium]